MDNRKYILFTFLGAASLIAMAVSGLGAPLMARFEVGDPQILGMFNATSVAGFILGVVVFFVLNRHELAYRFTDEAITELRKVTWPDREETVRSAIVVLTCTVILAGTLGFYDFVWARLTGFFLFTES